MALFQICDIPIQSDPNWLCKFPLLLAKNSLIICLGERGGASGAKMALPPPGILKNSCKFRHMILSFDTKILLKTKIFLGNA
jgi:hypothetical protein